MFLAPLHNFKSDDLCNLLNSSSAIYTSITSILKSLMMILAIWLALVGAFIQESHQILLYIASFYNNLSDFKAYLKRPVIFEENERKLLQLFTNHFSTESINNFYALKNPYLSEWILQFQNVYNKV